MRLDIVPILLIILSLFFYIHHVSADIDSDADPNIAILNGEPSSIVDGCVNVITGTFIDYSVDMVTAGTQPLALERLYTSKSGWIIHSVENIYMNEKCLQWCCQHIQNGSSIDFYSPKEGLLKVRRSNYKQGLTNCSAGVLNGRTNACNTELKTQYQNYDRSFQYKNGAGSIKYFDDATPVDADFDSLYHLTKELKPNGNSVHYTYQDTSEFGTIADKIVTKNSLNQPLNHLKFNHKALTIYDTSLVIETNDQQKTVYGFNRHPKRRQNHLWHVNSCSKPVTQFTYHDDMLAEISRPEGRKKCVDYYQAGTNTLVGLPAIYINKKTSYTSHMSNHFIATNVKMLRAPVGKDATPVMTHQFIYNRTFDPKKNPFDNLIKGNTIVLNALNHPTNYEFDDCNRLTQIHDHLTSLYRKHKLIWGEFFTPVEGNLIYRLLTDSQDRIASCKHYTYDTRGNILRESLSGVLTGTNFNPITQITTPDYSRSDVYSKSYAYSDDGLNLMVYENDERKESHYRYKPVTELLTCKLITSNKQIVYREYYTYDENGLVTRKAWDDGCVWEEANLTNVTEKHITYTKYTRFQPIGLPQIIEEKYLDLSSNQEILLNRTENVYNNLGKLIQQNHYDANDQYRFCLNWEYDSYGNVTKKTDPYGYVTLYYYDANHNLFIEHNLANDYYTRNTYDFANRLIRTENVHADSSVLVTRHDYNLLSQRERTIDWQGHETSYRYDALGRLIETIFPAVLDANGVLYHPKESCSYDICDNRIQVINRNGIGTNFAYTIRGQPYRIQYTDTTFENIEYTLDGLVSRQIALNGTITSYDYDYLGRVLAKKVHAPTGELLNSVTTQYNHFQKISESDAAGVKTHYKYDHAVV